jgi:hypothetical protein
MMTSVPRGILLALMATGIPQSVVFGLTVNPISANSAAESCGRFLSGA